MCQAPSSSSRSRNDVVAAGKGFLLGASAVASLFLLKDFVTSGDLAASTSEPTLPNKSPSAEEQEFRGFNHRKHNVNAPETSKNEAIPTATALNNEISVLPTQSSVPSAAPSTRIPTYIPTAAGEIPTDMPTQFLQDDISSAVIKLRSSNEVGFRLKLYWERGFYWQESSTETFWCMSCSSGKTCKRNDKIELRDCKNKSSRHAQFVASSIGKGHQFRVANTNLCLQKSKRGASIKLKPCNKVNKLQHLVGFKSGGKFDLRPSTSTKRCLSQHHHPKSGEKIYAETCTKAHRFDTGYWVAY